MQLKVKTQGSSTFQDVIIQGLKGADGKDGKDGVDGVSVPTGGTANQVLVKNSSTNYDFSWKASHTTTNVSVPVSAWAADTTYAEYGFKASITVSGVTANNDIIVSPLATSTAEQEAACAKAGVLCKGQAANTIYLYAKEQPEIAFTITVVILV